MKSLALKLIYFALITCFLSVTDTVYAQSYDFLRWQADQGQERGLDYHSQLADYEIYEFSRSQLLALRSANFSKLSLELLYAGQVLQLQLEQNELFDQDFRVLAGSRARAQEAAVDAGIHYGGTLAGFPNAKVALSIFRHDLVLVIDDPNLGLINLGQLRDYPTDKTLGFIAYAEDDRLEPLQSDCSTDDELVVSSVVEARQNSLITNSYCFSSYLECDFALYEEQNSSLDDVTAFITGAFNVVAVLFDAEDIEATISEIFIWTTPDGYPTNNSSDALDAFSDAMATGFNGDLAHLISRNPNNLGGRAYVNVVCNSNSSLRTAYSNINATYNEFPQYSWTVNVLAHEIGHNLGSRHTHRCVWNGNNTQIDDCGNVWAEEEGDTPEGDACYDTNNPILPGNGGTIMSYCHLVSGLGVNFNEGFGLQPGDRIRTVLSDCSECSVNPPANDLCAEAELLSCDAIIDGTTLEATSAPQLGDCNGVGLNTAPGVWYRYEGDGATLSLLACSSSFDPIMGVFSGTCDDLTCIDSHDDGCPSGTSVPLVIPTQIGETYYIYITGMGTDSGDFGLSVNCEFPTEVNDLCEDALAIACGVTLTGSTLFASNDDAPLDCGTDLDAAPGVWYILQGDGSEVTVSTCGSITGFDTKLGIFSGSCSNLVCVTGDDDDPSCALASLFTTVTFNSAPGETYYIYVTGFSQDDVGVFDLSVNCTEACLPPATIFVDETGYAYADISYTAATAASEYQLRYRQQGAGGWNEPAPTTDLSIIIGNLMPCTTYEVQVASMCDNDTSPFSSSFFFETEGCGDDYCYSYGDSFSEWIAGVSLLNIDNPSGNGYGYTNFTALEANVEAGNTYELTLTPATDVTPVPVFWDVWIDFDQDGTFSGSELVVSTSTFSDEVAEMAPIAIPANATSGATRMRISMSATGGTSDPCAIGQSRDIEDYSIVIGNMSSVLAVTPDTLFFPATGGVQQATVTSNIDWTATESADWFSLFPTFGSGNGNISVTCETNTDPSVRFDEFEVSGDGLSGRVVIVQEGAPPAMLSVTPDTLFFPAAGGMQSATVMSNVDWTAMESADWFSISSTSGSGDGNIAVTCNVNADPALRFDQVMVSGGGLSSTLVIVQEGTVSPILSTDPDTLFFPAAGGMQVATVLSNINWTATESADWFSIAPTSGNGDGSITVACDVNTETTLRFDEVIVSGDGLSRRVVIVQSGVLPFIEVDPALVFFDPPGGSDEVEVESNVSWTVVNPAPWLTITPMSGTGNQALFIECDEYDEPDLREALITVQMLGGATATTFLVEQLGTSVFCEDVIVELDIEICAGETYTVGDETFGEDGFYSVTLTGAEGCDSIVTLDLAVFDPVAVLPEVLTTCPGDLVELIAPTAYLIGLDGVADRMSLTLDVGTYQISVLDMIRGCPGEGTVTVLNDGGLAVSISGATEICAGEEVLLTALPDATYLWNTGETTGTIIITEPGSYCVTATDENNCEGTACIDVLPDTQPPIFASCPDNITLVLDEGETTTAVDWTPPVAVDNCGLDGITVSGSNDPGDSFGVGETMVTYTAEDGSGNTEECVFIVEVVETEPMEPLTFYLDLEGYSRSGDTICVPVRVLNFTDVAAFQFSLAAEDEQQSRLDTIVAVSPLIGVDGAGGLLYQSEGENLAQILWLNGTGDGLTLADDTEIFTVKLFADVANGECVPLDLTGDPLAPEAFVVGTGPVVPELIGGDLCITLEIDISGRTYRIDELPIRLTEVNLLSLDTNRVDTTNVAGQYSFPQVESDVDYTLLPLRDFGDVDGLSILDMITILRHVQGRAFIENPYLLMAADVNNTSSITVADILEIRELILNNVIEFMNKDSWFFVPVTYEFPDPTNPWLEPVPDRVELMAPAEDQFVDFFGIKTGDVNLTNDGQNFNSDETVLHFNAQAFNAGQSILVPLYADDLAQLSGLQVGLQIDPAYLQLEEVIPGTAELGGSLAFGTANWAAGELPLLFLRTATQTTQDADAPLLTLRLSAQAAGRVSDALSLNHQVLPQQAYDDALQALTIRLEERQLTGNQLPEAERALHLVSVQPNPFREALQLEFAVPEATVLQLQLVDARGQQVQSTVKYELAPGNTILTLPTPAHLPSGLYWCYWQTEQQGGVVKVVKE